MNKRVYFDGLLFLFASLMSCQSGQGPVTGSMDRMIHQLDSIGQQIITQGNNGAIAFAVVQDDSLLYNNAFGYANRDEKIPVTTDHYFNMASISKLVGSTMVMKLVEEGKLDLDQTLIELLPDFPRKDQAQQITLRHLLSHTSGLLDYAIEIDTQFMRTGKPPTREDCMDFFSRHDLLFSPGTYHAYSNSGFKLMEYIIEEATGRSFPEEIKRIIRAPTGLDINLIANRTDDPLMTEELNHTDSTLENGEHWTWIRGDGGMTATAADLAHFAQKWSDGTIISQESFHEMTTRTTLNSGIQTGYGIGTRTGTFEDEYVVGHTGGNKTTQAMMMYFPEKDLSIVVFDNTDGTPTSALTIMGYVALAVLNRTEITAEGQNVSFEDSSAYVGRYNYYGYTESEAGQYDIYYDSEEKSWFKKRVGSESNGQRLIALGGDVFATDPYVMDRFDFVRNEEGTVVAYRHYYNGLFQQMGFKTSGD